MRHDAYRRLRRAYDRYSYVIAPLEPTAELILSSCSPDASSSAWLFVGKDDHDVTCKMVWPSSNRFTALSYTARFAFSFVPCSPSQQSDSS
jgi:hypothetical protein